MPFLETRVRIQHPCPYCDLSAAFPNVEMALWTSTHSDVFHVSATALPELQKLLRTMRETIGAKRITQDGSSALVVTHRANWDFPPSVTGLADRRGLWLFPPTIYLGGWETYRVISPTIGSLRRFVADVKKIGAVEVLSHRARDQLERIRSLATVPVHLFEGLTERQIHVVVRAIEGGLFQLPAKERMDRIAAREGLSRSTFGEHLRKAEAQLLRNSYPFLKLRDQTSESEKRTSLRRTQGAAGESPVGIASGPDEY
jgi:predicted DNA binding protein